MPYTEKQRASNQDKIFILLGVRVPRSDSSPGQYWHTARCGYNMGISLDLDNLEKPYRWDVSTYGCSFTDSGVEETPDLAVYAAHVRLARYIQEVESVRNILLSFLGEAPRSPLSRFERDPVV